MHEIAWNAYNDLLMINSEAAGFSPNHNIWGQLYMSYGWSAANDILKFFDEGAFSWGKYQLNQLNPKCAAVGAADNGISGFVVNKMGNIVAYNTDPNDKSIYMQSDDGTITNLGKIGGTLHTEDIIDNIIQENIKTAKEQSVFDILGFIDLVETGKDWDYKNSKENLIGILNGTGTLFAVRGWGYMDSQHFGNFHFGIVAAAWGYPESFAKWGGGIYQLGWQGSPYMEKSTFYNLLINPYTGPLMLGFTFVPPHGDYQMDYFFVGLGYSYYNKRYGD